ncbi:MAG: hypothetical protein FWC91_06420 [Defluviitaleaceae bacterium]|nr:hypothetical protein [Defluviitaleaceae bacterium]
MKKIAFFIVIIFAITLIWVFRPFSANQETHYLNLEDFIQQISNDIRELTYEEQQETIKKGRENGIEVNFRNDGSVIFEHEDGTTAIVNSDGSWVFDDLGWGTGLQIGGDFPLNELTQLIPVPSFPIYGAMGNEINYLFTFYDVTLTQIREYAEQSRARGFTIDERLFDGESILGGHFFDFTAHDLNGNIINVTYSSNSATITIERP